MKTDPIVADLRAPRAATILLRGIAKIAEYSLHQLMQLMRLITK